LNRGPPPPRVAGAVAAKASAKSKAAMKEMMAGGNVAKKSIDTMVNGSNLSSLAKETIRDQFHREVDELDTTRKQIRAELPSSRAWNALTTMSRLIWERFQALVTDIFENLSKWLSSDPSTVQIERVAQRVASRLSRRASRSRSRSKAKQQQQPWWKLTGAAFLNLVRKVASTVVEGFKLVFAAARQIWPSVQSLIVWITTNPHTAKMALVMANFMRKTICRQLANWWQNSQSTVNFFDPVAMAKDLSGPMLTKAVGDVAKSKTVDAALDSVTGFLADSLSALPVVGGLLKATTQVVGQSLKQSCQEAIEFYVYYASVTQSFTLVVDLINPRPCIQAFQQQLASLNEIMQQQ